MFLSNLGKIGDQRGQNLNIFLKSGCRVCKLYRLFGVSAWVCVQALWCYFADVSKIGQDTAGCSAFCPLSRFVFGALSLNVALFRVLRGFLEGFMGFVWVCVACVLCLACVAFVRVWS